MQIQTALSRSFSISHVHHQVFPGSLLVKVQVSLLDARLCSALESPLHNGSSKTAFISLLCGLAESVLPDCNNKQNIAEEVSEGATENSEEGDDAVSPFFKEL